MNVADYVWKVILAGAIIDLMIVFFMIISVAQGQPVEHTTFWDNQVRFILDHGIAFLVILGCASVGAILGEEWL